MMRGVLEILLFLPFCLNAVSMDRSKLLIGTYRLQPEFQDEQHICEMSDAGIDFLVPQHVKAESLDLFEKYGVGIMLGEDTVPWRSGSDQESGRLEELFPLSLYESVFGKRFLRHPAVWGYKTADELSALDFPYFGKVVARLKELAPNEFAYYNAFPCYALATGDGECAEKSQLGADSYASHIAEYCKWLPLDYICFDCYCYAWTITPAVLIENCRVVADACAGTGKSMWTVLQANVYRDKAKGVRCLMNVDRLRMQANIALAFGAESINWACWGKGWFEGDVLDEKGNKTPTYEMLKKVNGELHRLGVDYMRYRRVATDLVGSFRHEDRIRIGQPVTECASFAVFQDVATLDGTPLLVGKMLPRDGSGGYALYVVSCADMNGENICEHEIRFKIRGMKVRAVSGEGEVRMTVKEDGFCSCRLKSCCGILLTAN